jgi:hypothetical protein
MKKALIPALLIVCATLTPRLPSAFNFPCSELRLTAALASPVFWNLYDALLAKVIVQVTSRAAELTASPWTICDSFAPPVSEVLLGHGLEGVRYSEPDDAGSEVSISRFSVRRIVERELATVREGSAKHRLGEQNKNKEKSV